MPIMYAAPENMSLWPRQFAGISNDVNNVKTTFSSWDSCMSKAYCKWPVIAAIIIGSLIIISLLTCLFRCLCCGAECCCGCLRCCNACCPSPRSRSDKYAPAPQQPYGPPPPAYAYQPQAPMHYGAPPPQQPQFASFESSGKSGQPGRYNEDALPAMPSWATARERKVEDDTPLQEEKDSIPLQDQKPLGGERDPMLPNVAAMPANPSRTASPFHSPKANQSPFHPPPGQSPFRPPPSQSPGPASPYGGPQAGFDRSQSPYAPGNSQYSSPRADDYAPAEFPPNEYPPAVAAGAYGSGHRSPPPLRAPQPRPYMPMQAQNGNGYPGQVPDGAMELPGNSPSSPVASSIYSSTTYGGRGGPAPSYHTQAPPMPMPGAGPGAVHRNDSFSRPFAGQRSPPPQQSYAGYSAYTPYNNQPTELPGASPTSSVQNQGQYRPQGQQQQQQQQSPSAPYPGHQSQGSWGDGRPRKPVAGSYREV